MKSKITFSISTDIIEKLRKEANERALPLSTLVQLVLENYLKGKEKGENE